MTRRIVPPPDPYQVALEYFEAQFGMHAGSQVDIIEQTTGKSTDELDPREIEGEGRLQFQSITLDEVLLPLQREETFWSLLLSLVGYQKRPSWYGLHGNLSYSGSGFGRNYYLRALKLYANTNNWEQHRAALLAQGELKTIGELLEKRRLCIWYENGTIEQIEESEFIRRMDEKAHIVY